MLDHADACSAHQLRALCIYHIQVQLLIDTTSDTWLEAHENENMILCLTTLNVAVAHYHLSTNTRYTIKQQQLLY